MTRWIALGLGVILYLFAANAVMAQTPNCAPRPAVIAKLANDYSENRQSVGIASNGALVETFANLDTGSWSILVTGPNMVACLVASGGAFEVLDEELPVSGDPT